MRRTGVRSTARGSRHDVRSLPTTTSEWLVEIALAWMDAAAGARIAEARLFHVAPLVALKFRGWKPVGKKADGIRKTALANYVVKAARAKNGKATSPKMAFAICYVAAHFAMDLVGEDTAHEILRLAELNLERGLD